MFVRKHFAYAPTYLPLVALFRSVHMKTIFGQSIDMTSCWNPTMTSDPTEALEALTSAFTRRRYEAICINKTSLYSFVLPVLGISPRATVGMFVAYNNAGYTA